MFRIYGLNVDAFKQDEPARFFQQVADEKPDVVCLQETGRGLDDFPAYAWIDGYDIWAEHDPTGPGRNGVAIMSRHPVRPTSTVLCDHLECKGRFIELTVGGLKIASVYAHAHNSKDQARWQHRRQFNECLGRYIRANADERCIVALDANVALTSDDTANETQWKGPWANGSNGLYRTPIYDAMTDAGWADSYRVLHGKGRRATVWFPGNFAPSNGTESGFGIDFQLISKAMIPTVREAHVFKPPSWSERLSDHAPTLGVYDIELDTTSVGR